jgi:hypothetical protein
LRAFENKKLRRIFGPKREGENVAGRNCLMGGIIL